MDADAISARIEQLVDLLREDQSAQLKLRDVASVTEVLLATMQRYFNSIDMAIYGELRQLSEHIQKARTEIAELRPSDLKEEKIPRAGKELEAIVQATEEATGTIMDAAEEIMSADDGDPSAYKQKVDDACMRIFEACSFQDITGQRITKVVTTLTHIEDRLTNLQAAWGSENGEPADGETTREYQPSDEEAGLLNGPALEGEGIDQDAVDNLLGGRDEEPEGIVETAAMDEGEDAPEADIASLRQEAQAAIDSLLEIDDTDESLTTEEPATLETQSDAAAVADEPDSVAKGADDSTVAEDEADHADTGEDTPPPEVLDDDDIDRIMSATEDDQNEDEDQPTSKESSQAEIDALFN